MNDLYPAPSEAQMMITRRLFLTALALASTGPLAAAADEATLRKAMER